MLSSLVALSAQAVDIQQFFQILTTKDADMFPDIDLLATHLPVQHCDPLRGLLAGAVQQPYLYTLQQRANQSYALGQFSQVVLRDVRRTSVEEISALRSTPVRTRPVRLLLLGSEGPLTVKLSTVDIPQELVSDTDRAMLRRLAQLPFIHWGYYANSNFYGTSLSFHPSAAEARNNGVTPDTERLFIMLGQHDAAEGDPTWPNVDVKDKWRLAAADAEPVIANFNLDPLALHNTQLVINPLEDVCTDGVETYLLRISDALPDERARVFQTSPGATAWVMR